MIKVTYKIPDAPDQPVCVTSDEDSITISYSAPSNDGGSPIIGYHIERKERKSSRWVKVTREPTLDLIYCVSGLVQNNKYEFRVYAENVAGLSEPSESSPFIICREPVCKYSLCVNIMLTLFLETSFTNRSCDQIFTCQLSDNICS